MKPKEETKPIPPSTPQSQLFEERDRFDRRQVKRDSYNSQINPNERQVMALDELIKINK